MRKILFSSLFLSIVLFVCHIYAIKYFLYWYYPWLDLVNHFIGGVVIALLSIFLFSNNYKEKIFIYLICGFVAPLVIAVLWECFEFMTGLTFASSKYLFDTITDILFALIGGLSSVYISNLLIDREI